MVNIIFYQDENDTIDSLKETINSFVDNCQNINEYKMFIIANEPLKDVSVNSHFILNENNNKTLAWFIGKNFFDSFVSITSKIKFKRSFNKHELMYCYYSKDMSKIKKFGLKKEGKELKQVKLLLNKEKLLQFCYEMPFPNYVNSKLLNLCLTMLSGKENVNYEYIATYYYNYIASNGSHILYSEAIENDKSLFYAKSLT